MDRPVILIAVTPGPCTNCGQAQDEGFQHLGPVRDGIWPIITQPCLIRAMSELGMCDQCQKVGGVLLTVGVPNG